MPIKVQMKAIHPKRFALSELAVAERMMLEGLSIAVLAQFRKVTATWEHKPRFSVSKRVTSKNLILTVTTDDEIFGWVNAGTEQHVIEPRSPVSKRNPARASSLAYRRSFRPKTRRGVIGSSAGGKTGEYVYPVSVTHPGIEAREFTTTIGAWAQEEMVRRSDAAMREALERAVVEDEDALRD